MVLGKRAARVGRGAPEWPAMCACRDGGRRGRQRQVFSSRQRRRCFGGRVAGLAERTCIVHSVADAGNAAHRQETSQHEVRGAAAGGRQPAPRRQAPLVCLCRSACAPPPRQPVAFCSPHTTLPAPPAQLHLACTGGQQGGLLSNQGAQAGARDSQACVQQLHALGQRGGLLADQGGHGNRLGGGVGRGRGEGTLSRRRAADAEHWKMGAPRAPGARGAALQAGVLWGGTHAQARSQEGTQGIHPP